MDLCVSSLNAMVRIVPIWRYSCLRCDLIKCVKWYVKCLILHKYVKMTNILCSKDNNFHSIGFHNPQNIGADINITFLLHVVLEISLLLQTSCCCGHLGGHFEFWNLTKWDSRGLLICYMWVYFGRILKKIACYEFCSHPTLMLLDYYFMMRKPEPNQAVKQTYKLNKQIELYPMSI